MAAFFDPVETPAATLSTTHRPTLFFVARFDYFLMANAIAKTAVANLATVSRRVRLPVYPP